MRQGSTPSVQNIATYLDMLLYSETDEVVDMHDACNEYVESSAGGAGGGHPIFLLKIGHPILSYSLRSII